MLSGAGGHHSTSKDTLAPPGTTSLLQTPQSQSAEYISPPKSWLTAFLQRTVALQPERRKIFEEISSALETILTPAEQHRNDYCYLELWVIYLELHYQLFQDEDECRRLWKYLKGTHCGTLHALFYLQYAVFEQRAGHPERAQVVLSSGLDGGSAPLLSNNEQLKLAQLGSLNMESYLKRRLDEFRLVTPPPSQQASLAGKPALSTMRRLGLGPPKRVVPGVAGTTDTVLELPPNDPVHEKTDKEHAAGSNGKAQNEPFTAQIENDTNSNPVGQQQPPPPTNNSQDQPSQSKSSRSIKINNKQYRVLCMVGKGGSSRVFKVISNEGQVFALKRVSLKNLDDFTFNSYLNEIDLLQRFTDANCKHIIKLVDSEVNRQSGHLQILMEYGEVDLGRLLKDRGESSTTDQYCDHSVKFYFTQMLKAVQSVHDAKIVHCDLKPANFLLVQGCLKLIDFGISKAILNDTTNIVRENQVGTVNYMSPEALSETSNGGNDGRGGQGKLKIGRSSDIWSLGCILYEMVHGAPPFAAFPTLVQRLKHIMDPAYDIPIPPSTNRYLDDLLRRCLARDPKQRPSLSEIALHPFLHTVPGSIMVTRGQIEGLLRRWVERRQSVEEGDVERVSGLIYEQWLGPMD
jgi:serine/threonine-protein kinase TTK/MPS1